MKKINGDSRGLENYKKKRKEKKTTQVANTDNRKKEKKNTESKSWDQAGRKDGRRAAETTD